MGFDALEDPLIQSAGIRSAHRFLNAAQNFGDGQQHREQEQSSKC
jgi:hypothetical protein